MKMRGLAIPAVLVAILAHPGGTARAGVDFYTLFKNNVYTQSSNAQPVAPTSAFFTAGLSFTVNGDVGAVQVTDSGPNSPLTLTQSGNSFNFGSGFGTTAQMDAAFPFGSPYNFRISGGTLGTQTASVSTPSSPLYSAIPFLTGSSYSLLQGLNASTASTITFNGFSPVAGATESDVFFTIRRNSDNAVVFSQGFLPASTTSVTLGANTLAANTAYNIDLDYSSRIITPNAGFNGASSLVGFEQRTAINFTTSAAVPEPASLALTGLGIASAVVTLRARRRK